MAYAVLIVSALFFEFAMNLPVGTMPLALTAEGSSVTAVSIAMGCGMFAALFGALPIGALVDRWGRLATIRASAALGVASLLALSVAHGPVLGGLLLGVRSIAVVGYMTAEFAYASELASKDRAVSDVATLGMIGNLSFALAPALSVLLWQHGIGREQYAWATVGAGLGALCLFALPRRHDVRSAGPRRLVLDARWLPACGFALAATMQGGVNGALAILTFHHRGIVNGAAIFTASAGTAFALRYLAGRGVDRFGPRRMAVPTAIAQGAGCLLAAHAASLGAVVVAGMCLGLAWAAVVPVALGLLFEHGGSETRGSAIGAYNLAFAGGSAIGALLATAATLAGGGYAVAITVCAVAPLAVLPYVLRSRAPGAAGRAGAGAVAAPPALAGAAGAAGE